MTKFKSQTTLAGTDNNNNSNNNGIPRRFSERCRRCSSSPKLRYGDHSNSPSNVITLLDRSDSSLSSLDEASASSYLHAATSVANASGYDCRTQRLESNIDITHASPLRKIPGTKPKVPGNLFTHQKSPSQCCRPSTIGNSCLSPHVPTPTTKPTTTKPTTPTKPSQHQGEVLPSPSPSTPRLPRRKKSRIKVGSVEDLQSAFSMSPDGSYSNSRISPSGLFASPLNRRRGRIISRDNSIASVKLFLSQQEDDVEFRRSPAPSRNSSRDGDGVGNQRDVQSAFTRSPSGYSRSSANHLSPAGAVASPLHRRRGRIVSRDTSIESVNLFLSRGADADADCLSSPAPSRDCSAGGDDEGNRHAPRRGRSRTKRVSATATSPTRVGDDNAASHHVLAADALRELMLSSSNSVRRRVDLEGVASKLRQERERSERSVDDCSDVTSDASRGLGRSCEKCCYGSEVVRPLARTTSINTRWSDYRVRDSQSPRRVERCRSPPKCDDDKEGSNEDTEDSSVANSDEDNDDDETNSCNGECCKEAKGKPTSTAISNNDDNHKAAKKTKSQCRRRRQGKRQQQRDMQEPDAFWVRISSEGTVKCGTAPDVVASSGAPATKKENDKQELQELLRENALLTSQAALQLPGRAMTMLQRNNTSPPPKRTYSPGGVPVDTGEDPGLGFHLKGANTSPRCPTRRTLDVAPKSPVREHNIDRQAEANNTTTRHKSAILCSRAPAIRGHTSQPKLPVRTTSNSGRC